VQSAEPSERRQAWEAIVAAYWRPVYKHVRLRWRLARADAEDATQTFFARAVERDFFADYDPARARFRTFVRMCVDRQIANESKARSRLKRGGGVAPLELDFDAAEAELDESAPAPDECFDREWRRSLFAIAIDRLGEELRARGKDEHLAVFERYDLFQGSERPSYEAVAAELGITATTVTNRLAYARRELRRLVLAELEQVTGSDEELHGEARLLLGIDVT
jgi:RNA polymerase sigma factor (sigma-70 family)